MTGLVRWWRQPDRFESTTLLLRQRGLVRSTQVIMTLIATTSALAPVTILAQPHRLTGSGLLVGVIGAVFCVLMMWFWLTRWPTRRQSQTMALIGTACVFLFSVAQPVPAVAALASTALTITGCYIAAFHSSRLLTLNMVVAFAAAAVATARLGQENGVTTGIAAFWLIMLLNIVGGIVTNNMWRAVTDYAVQSEQDPLTGLQNRRGFYSAVANLTSGVPAGSHLSVLMIDLDGFKKINDRHGHAAGDRVLVEVADLLRADLGPDTPICRAGGEEFLVALLCARPVAARHAGRLCRAVAGLPYSVTASIGVAAVALATPPAPDLTPRVRSLIASADTAMYQAKGKGGDRFEVWHDPRRRTDGHGVRRGGAGVTHVDIDHAGRADAARTPR